MTPTLAQSLDCVHELGGRERKQGAIKWIAGVHEKTAQDCMPLGVTMDTHLYTWQMNVSGIDKGGAAQPVAGFHSAKLVVSTSMQALLWYLVAGL